MFLKQIYFFFQEENNILEIKKYDQNFLIQKKSSLFITPLISFYEKIDKEKKKIFEIIFNINKKYIYPIHFFLEFPKNLKISKFFEDIQNYFLLNKMEIENLEKKEILDNSKFFVLYKNEYKEIKNFDQDADISIFGDKIYLQYNSYFNNKTNLKINF